MSEPMKKLKITDAWGDAFEVVRWNSPIPLTLETSHDVILVSLEDAKDLHYWLGQAIREIEGT